ncbi:MAG: RecQ family ATP-dependent DNA helicase [Treponema sp.]|nr:RecQ family ATP-dependent DNA helicase [Treponema sp.]MEE3434020.1 RecQ family ATP-dependent DNA helicase [Treponema sp.]
MAKTPEQILKSVFGYDKFRPGQKEIIQNILDGRDTLAVMPTGGGKSLCYQIPALIFDGITVVVSPLISLMQDQVGSLLENGVSAAFLNSTLNLDEYKKTVRDIKSGGAKLLYLSPEALATERVKSILREADVPVSCVTIDEAHCISEWGHDFRPDYMEIAAFRNEFKDAVCLALTATATKQVQADIVRNLKLKKPAVLVSSFNRANIFLNVQPRTDGLGQIVEFLQEHKEQSGIIYCLSRKEVDSITQELQERGFSAMSYHAGLSDEERADHQNKFIKSQVDVIVATVAFGMGINKPDVRFVIHYALPKSIEEYYQEIGRAGRDGLASEALLLYSAGDIHRIRFFFKDKSDDESFKAEKLLQAMIDYAQCRTCRRKFLLNYFGEEYNSEDTKTDCKPKMPPTDGRVLNRVFEENSLSSESTDALRTACCDICESGGLPLKDVTVPAQKFLSCVYRVDQRFGAAHIIDILLGSRNEKIKKFNHNFLSTWGIGTELSKQAWFELCDAMQNAGLIERVGEWNIVKVTSLGRELLQNRDKIELPVRIDFSAQKKAELALPKKKAVLHKKTELKDDAATQALFDRLKAWRKKFAEEENVPPYFIFNDKTLVEIANQKPSTRSGLLSINGIGELKAKKFGDDILRIIDGA